MHPIDWAVLGLSLVSIVVYGIWKTRKTTNVESYLLGDRDLKWWTIGLSIMATQASGITFLSTPGQAYQDGMRFIQFYFGLPLAMVILAIFVIPIYYRLKVYTAYEYLEGRFDLKTRQLTALLFLMQRGLAAGLTIYAPSIILSSILGWSLGFTNLMLGGLVIAYTVVGGTKAVSQTQQQQMTIILFGLFVALVVVLLKLPSDVSFNDALGVAGKMGKINLVDFTFQPQERKWWDNRYNFWTGMLGGTFLFLSYFGTDQSQVQRYLSGKSLTESRLGLLFNGILKVPMQFTVLFVGMMVFVFYQFNQSPIHFNETTLNRLVNDPKYATSYQQLSQQHTFVFEQKQVAIKDLIAANKTSDKNQIDAAQAKVIDWVRQDDSLRGAFNNLVLKQNPTLTAKNIDDTDYVFINFVLHHLPIGLVGLLIAVIFAASMSSTSSELNALATTTIIDIYRRSIVKNETDNHYLRASKIFTLIWGAIILAFATLASLFDNLIEAVNVIGSLFYGVILGIFLTAFFIKKVQGNAVFLAALLSELIIIILFQKDVVAYLWLNMIGCLLVICFALIFQTFIKSPHQNKEPSINNMLK